jgi:hypothetical protein
MRVLRRSAIVAVVAGVLFGGAVPVSAAGITIDPSVGSQSDTYTIQGIELPPGLALDIHFKSPDGNVYSTAALNQVVVVDPDGNFNFQFVPTDEFTGEKLGSWGTMVCTAGTDDCVQTTFDIGG